MIDKTKAYRFKGDSERWEFQGTGWLVSPSGQVVGIQCAEHLHSRGILLEYPELPGEDWEFCDASDQELWWSNMRNLWLESHEISSIADGFYCRKKKPVYESGTAYAKSQNGVVRIPFKEGTRVYWTTDPVKGKELLK